MAEAILIFDENDLDKTPSLHELYDRFYEGMRLANTVDAPDFLDNPPTTESGKIDVDTITQKMSEYSTILIKNAAYTMANSIASTIHGSESGGTAGIGFLSRNGDSMAGLLGALYGFRAGYEGKIILETVIHADERKTARISGYLTVDSDIDVSGKLNLSDTGIYMSGNNVFYYEGSQLNITSGNIRMSGAITVGGSFQLGQIIINESGLFYGDDEFYHSANSNKSNIDWSMRNGYVYGNLRVDGKTDLNELLTAVDGFKLGSSKKSLFYSDKREDGSDFLQLATDLSLWSGYGIQFDGKYIVKVRGGAENTVSFSAPGMTINLGDSDNGKITNKIALQTGIYNYNSNYQIISQYGDGNFPNSLSAGCGNSGPVVLQTYYKASNDCGTVFPRRVRFYNSSGPSLYAEDIEALNFEAPYLHVINLLEQADYIKSSISYKRTNSLFRNQSLLWSASLHFDTDAEFFVFNKPVEAASFSIISEQYKTQLLENALFFNDGIFLEGITDGILHSGNAYFTGSLSSRQFAGGFAGYGWSISQDKIYGNIAAIFDELTIRKKMRVYELEVQKSTVTNGSLWVSDYCSGDSVEEII
ncbi:MAG: hypothetical protein LBK58_15930 [Prevotellaceae bacterium]|jgi:hypothetical protein|nr:hypothetical protein [Prevotellaceae bacterium]